MRESGARRCQCHESLWLAPHVCGEIASHCILQLGTGSTAAARLTSMSTCSAPSFTEWGSSHATSSVRAEPPVPNLIPSHPIGLPTTLQQSCLNLLSHLIRCSRVLPPSHVGATRPVVGDDERRARRAARCRLGAHRRPLQVRRRSDEGAWQGVIIHSKHAYTCEHKCSRRSWHTSYDAGEGPQLLSRAQLGVARQVIFLGHPARCLVYRLA